MPSRSRIVALANAIAALACLCAAASAALVAQERPVLRITLDQAQARAIEASHRIAEFRAREAAAGATTALREADKRPQVTASAGYSRTSHVTEFVVPSATGAPRVLYPDLPDNYRTRLNLQWPIYSGGRSDALERAARAEAAAALADIAVARADLRLEVSRAFWALVTARSSVDVLTRGVTRTQAHLADVRARFDAGFVPPNEVASAEAQESRARMLLIEATNQRDLAEADLARLIGAAIGQAIEPDAQLDRQAEGTPAAAAGDFTALAAAARSGRDDRLSLQHRADAAAEQRAAAASGRHPTIALEGNIDYARPNARIFPRADRWDEFWDLGVTVAWPLWDGGRTRAQAAQASGVAEAARQRLAEFDSVLNVEVRQRMLEISSGRAAIAAAADAVRAAAEARRVVGERYGAGVITQTEVLDAEFALLQAELDRTRALAQLRLSEARLARALGQ